MRYLDSNAEKNSIRCVSKEKLEVYSSLPYSQFSGIFVASDLSLDACEDTTVVIVSWMDSWHPIYQTSLMLNSCKLNLVYTMTFIIYVIVCTPLF